jgi:hypothetical protein
MKNASPKRKNKPKAPLPTAEFRPYRVIFLVVVIAVTCLVMFAVLGVSTDYHG